MQTGTAAVAAEHLGSAQADLLTGPCKVVGGGVSGQAPAAFADKASCDPAAKDQAPCGPACGKAFGGADRDRNEAALAVLGVECRNCSMAASRSTSRSLSPSASLPLRPVTASSPKSVDRFRPRSP